MRRLNSKSANRTIKGAVGGVGSAAVVEYNGENSPQLFVISEIAANYKHRLCARAWE